jgi:hypothetical protein
MTLMTDEDGSMPLPTALRDLLARARPDLKTQKRAIVTIGDAEVRGVYALSTAVNNARRSRDKLRAELRAQGKLLEEARQAARDQNLLNNRAVVSLLIEVERILSGEVQDEAALRAVHGRVAAFVRRSAQGDRRKTAQQRIKRAR